MHDDGAVIELAPFRLRAGASEAALLEASDAVQDFLAGQPGFVRRELARGADGRWADVVLWTDQASVDAAMARVGESAACQAYFALMAGANGGDDPGEGLVHLRRVRAY